MASGSLGPPDAAEKREKPRIQIHLPSILKGGFRFVVFALPLKKQRDVDEEMEKLLKFAMRWIRIRRVYLDCKFYQVEVVRLLKRLGVKFIIRARIRGKLDDRAKRAKPPTVFKYTVRSKKGEEEANMVVVRGREGKLCFLTNLEVTSESAEEMADEFGKRWGIETSYRVMKDFRPRTASPDWAVRIFLFMFAVLLHDCWVLANLAIGELVLNFIPSKPFITAKMFCLAIYIPGRIFDPG